MNELPSQQYLFETFALDSESNLIWRKRPLHHFKNQFDRKAFNENFEDAKASSMDKDGKNVVFINGAWFDLDRVLHKIVNGFDIQ